MLSTVTNQIEIESIVAKSRTLAERLSFSYFHSGDRLIDSQKSLLKQAADDLDSRIAIEERLRQWCQIIAQGDFTKFKKRLSWAGLNFEMVYPLLADRDVNEVQSLPDWANTLKQAIELAQNISTDQIFAPEAYLDLTDPIPFEQIYSPFLQIARALLLDKIDARIHLLSESVLPTLERQLLLELNGLGFATLMSEFSTFKPTKNILQNIATFSNKNNISSIKYNAFVRQLFADGLQSLFLKYSVLGRLIATKVNLWVDKIREFIERLAANWSQIEHSFSPKQSLSKVTTIKTGLSDPHSGGRDAILLTFNTGIELVYKPENIGIDVAFYQLLAWFNSQNALLPFKVIRVISYGTYGWIEHVKQKPCASLKEVNTFYQRAGILLALIYLLKGKDCHSEKIVADGEHLILIDSKNLLHHQIKSDGCLNTTARELTEAKLNSSVLQTQMLPRWGMFADDCSAIDLTALGGTEEQKLTIPRVQKINTDAMHIAKESYVAKQANIPQFRNEPLNARNHLADIILGFEQMYDVLCSHRELLLAANSPLQNFTKQKVRYSFRATKTYQTILSNSFHPDLLQSGIDRSISIDILSRAFITEAEKPVFWSILDAELKAIEGLDIPVFEVNTERTDLELAGVTVPELFEESSFEAVMSRLKSLSEKDLAFQLEIIRGSFCAKYMDEDNCITLDRSFNTQCRLSGSSNIQSSNSIMTSKQLVQEAVAIAEELQQRGIYDDRSVAWIAQGLRPNRTGFQLQGSSNNLYDGCCGIALFFAALTKITKNSNWQNLALKTLQPLRNDLKSINLTISQNMRRAGIGGATGLGSIVYSLVQISHLIGDSNLIKDAKKVASLITTEAIARDGCFNLMDGTAGTILACLKLYEVEPSALELAIACGDRLLDIQDVVSERLETGLAKGTAGIAYALSQLFEVTQDSKYLVGAEQIIASIQDYSDTNLKKIIFNNSWASGNAGVSLGHLGMLSTLDSRVIRQQLDRSIAITQKHCLSDVDNLAWGNFGRIETLLIASQTLNRPELYDFVLQAATTLVRQAQLRGRFNLNSPSVATAYNPSFFHGTSGIGYQLLKIAYPHLLPSILLWE